MTARLIDDCFVLDKDRLPHHEALAILKSRVRTVVGTEEISLDEAAGRFLAKPIISPRPIPAHDNAAVDGYAFAHSAYDQKKGARLKIAGEAAAGHPFKQTPPPDSAVRIFTGAVMPPGFDTVAMQEDVRIEEKGEARWAVIPPGLKQGANRRLAGEDAKGGAVLVAAGTRLRPQEVASAAATGLGRLSCYAPLKVAVLSSGDEILRPGEAFAPGQVYDANAPMLQGLVRAAGAEAVDFGVLPDKAEQVRASLSEASRAYNVIVISGGASQGAEDHVVKSIDALGKRHLWQIAIKPGRPMSFGQIGDCVVLGLPGNPVAVFVCFLIYVRPVLTRLAGGAWPELSFARRVHAEKENGPAGILARQADARGRRAASGCQVSPRRLRTHLLAAGGRRLDRGARGGDRSQGRRHGRLHSLHRIWAAAVLSAA
jgi:molybdopterin molybdotransferase